MCSIRDRIFGENKYKRTLCELYENYKDFCFYDKNLVEEAQSNQDIQDFLEILALRNNVISQQDENEEIQCRSSNLDEEALVTASRCFGYSLIHSDQNQYKIINVFGIQ